MGILKRFEDIVKANVNAALENAEDPIKMANQYLLNAREDLKKLRNETVEVIAEENRCRRELENLRGQIDRFEGLAKKAVLGGNDGDARIFIEKKQKLEENEKVFAIAYQTAVENAEKMKAMHDKLIDDIRTLEERKRSIEQKMAIADAAEKINRYKGASAHYEVDTAAFDRMEAKANKALDIAMARGTLDSTKFDPAYVIEEKYIEGPNAVDEELAKMKAELN